MVIKVEGIMARVAVKQNAACEGCQIKDSCSTTSGEGAELEAVNEANAKAGQTVKISMKPYTYLKGTMLVYGIPLVLFIVAAIAGKEIGKEYFTETGSDLVAAVSGFAALVLSLLIIRLWSRKTESKTGYKPVIVKILH